MKFRTEVDIVPIPLKMEHHHKFMTIGSCFAENIAQKLEYFFFPLLSNPYGVLYNPFSIRNTLDEIIRQKKYTKQDLFAYEGMWHSYQHHSVFSSADYSEVLKNININIQRSHEFLKSADWIIITYGTAYIYRLIDSGAIAANCHKLPAARFSRERMEPEQIAVETESTISILRQFNPDIKIVFSVSPIRHWKDGAVRNQLSKASLILAVHKALAGIDKCYYFPSYEIMMDDLRDYRFYEDNLLHPNRQAIEYIWEKFCETALSKECVNILPQFGKLRQASAHKPFDTNSQAHQKFVLKNLRYIETLRTKFPYAEFSPVKNVFLAQINQSEEHLVQ